MKLLSVLVPVFFFISVMAQDSSSYTNTEIIYARKDGMALTMLKLSPKQNAKGKAIITVVSGNWISGYNMIPSFIKRSAGYIQSGYTIFLVMHGTQPRYAIPDQTEDIKRAVRFIRYNAAEYAIDSAHIGIMGYSSGGHLSLMTALAEDKLNMNARDAVDKVSARVHAAAVFYPPTDFLNWGAANTGVQREMIIRAGVGGAFDFKKLSETTRMYETIAEDSARQNIARQISPVYSVSADDPPVLIIHGDADPIVPLQQSQILISKLKDAGVTNELIIKPGAGHGWRDVRDDEKKFIEWFDKYLK